MADVRVPDTFKDKTLFVTGGSGFIGKVLIEKILRSCPGVKKIFVLLRERRGKSIRERLDDISKLPLFERLHSERPGDFEEKVVPVNGDITTLGLALSPEDRQLLIDEVNIIYHVAATVKFDQALSEAILMNIRGTRDVCNLSLEMKQIDLMVHVSTAYAHTEHNPIEEKMYPARGDWREFIKAAERIDPFQMSMMHGHVLGPYPNTYTYTKSLAERVVFDLLDGKVKNLIIRPSIIISTWKDPVPGWIDNFNGPIGMLAANGTGLIRINLIREQTLDFVPVDIAVRIFLNVTWYRLTQEHDHNIAPKATSVHNCSAYNFARLTTFGLAQIAHDLSEEAPLATCVWYPSLRRTESQTIFNFAFLFLQLIPALFYDLILRVLNYRPVVLMIQHRIYVAVNALKFFILNEWAIDNHSTYSLEAKLSERDIDEFGYDAHGIEHRSYIKSSMVGAKKYLLKEDMSKMDFYRKKFMTLKYADYIFNILFYAYMTNLFFFRWNVPGLVYNGLGNYFESLEIPLSNSNVSL